MDEVTNLLSKYILNKKAELFDHRNIKLAIVKEDPLGAVFGVNSFHRCQVQGLLRAQLIYLDPAENPEVYEGQNMPESDASLPAFPALNKAASLPACAHASEAFAAVPKKRHASGDGKT